VHYAVDVVVLATMRWRLSGADWRCSVL